MNASAPQSSDAKPDVEDNRADQPSADAWQDEYESILTETRKLIHWTDIVATTRAAVFTLLMIMSSEIMRKTGLVPKASGTLRYIIDTAIPCLVFSLSALWAYSVEHKARSIANARWIMHLHHYASVPNEELRQSGFDLIRSNGPADGLSPGSTRKSAIGTPMADWWPGFVAELVAYVAEVGLPAGVGHQGQSTVIKEVFDRLAEQGKPEPSRTQVQDTVNAVLRRMRSADEAGR